MRRQVYKKGDVNLNGFIIPSYVLEDGTRVLSARAMQSALKMVDAAQEGKQTAGTRLTRYLGQKSLKPFIFKENTQDHFEPLVCYDGELKINGYEATILADICEGFLEARNSIKLSKRQEIIAERAEILIRAFARVGIIALVDEATGYQYDREREELQQILRAYISPELLAWEKTFPDIFYKELFRLNGWDFTVTGIKKRPGVIGTWTNKLVYEQLPRGVLGVLKSKTPKSSEGHYRARFFQSLTPEIGNPHLKSQLNQIVTLTVVNETETNQTSLDLSEHVNEVSAVSVPQRRSEIPSTGEIVPCCSRRR